MIFTGFKRKSAQFFFNKQLVKLLGNSEKHASNKVKSILVFLDEILEKEPMQQSLINSLGVSESQLKFVVFQITCTKKIIFSDHR